MSKIKQLTKLKNKILDKLITNNNVEKAKNHYTHKGSYFKKLIKYLFLKPLKIKSNITKEDSFFVLKNGKNQIKELILFLGVIIFGCSAYGLLFSIKASMILFFIMSSISVFLFFLFVSVYLPLMWRSENLETKKKFNSKNIESIKNSLFENYTANEIKYLLQQKLDKKDLEEIFFVMNEVVGKEELFKIFKKLGFQESGENISEPYVLISIINEAIKNIKNKEQEEKEDARDASLKENKKMFDSLVETKTNNIEYETA